MKKISYLGYVFAAIAGMVFTQSAANAAGTVILEGSDAIGFHCTQEGQAGACTYEAQVWKALDGSSGKPIAVIYNPATIGDEGSASLALSSVGSGVTIDNFTSVAAAGSLSQYAAVYFESGGGCCREDDSTITAAGATAAITSYINGGGTVMIEDYIGGTAWDFATGAGGAGNSGGHSAGFGTNDPTFSCTDGETVTATGLANGFTQPPPISCWEHQAYQNAFFGGLTSINGNGFTLSFFAADPSAGVGAGYSGLLSDGVTLSASTPEPSTLALLGFGLAAAGFFGRKRIRG